MDATDSSTPRMKAPSYPSGTAHEIADPARDLLTAEEVASVLRVTPAWVYAQTRRRRIPHLRLGRYVRYRREALDEWIEQVESSSSLPPGRRRDGNRRALR
jgi:excisionase family DNA binding protein